MAKDRFQQAMLIGIGIMVAIGFSGVFTYSNLVQTPNSGNNNDDRQEFNGTLPSENYINGSYELSITEQANLAVNEQVTFVSVLYEDEKINYSQMSGIPQSFNNTVYINAINMSESTFASGRSIPTPSALVIGDQPMRTQRGNIPYSLRTSQITAAEVKSTICSVKRDVTPYGAVCYS